MGIRNERHQWISEAERDVLIKSLLLVRCCPDKDISSCIKEGFIAKNDNGKCRSCWLEWVQREAAKYIADERIAISASDLDRAKILLAEVYDSTGGKVYGACPVCGTYTHKGWCWYPRLLEFLGKPLDNHDKAHLERV